MIGNGMAGMRTVEVLLAGARGRYDIAVVGTVHWACPAGLCWLIGVGNRVEVRCINKLALADLLMRNGDCRAAIELCEAAIATAPSRFFIASYEQLLATAYSFVKDAGHSIVRKERALQAFEGSTRRRVGIEACVAHRGYLGLERARG